MILEEIRAIHGSDKDLRRFCYIICAALVFVGLYQWWSTAIVIPVWFLAGFGILVAGVIKPGVIKPLYKVWMGFAVVMGHIMTAVILSLLYYIVVTPIGLVMRLFGKDVLHRKPDLKAPTYWIDRSKEHRTVKQAEAQF